MATDDSSSETVHTTEVASSQATETGNSESSIESAQSGDVAPAASSGVETQSSAGGAAAIVATLAPALGGAVVGVVALL